MPAWCVRGKVYPQFDGHALASRNCGVSVARSQVQFGSRGKVSPSAGAIRARMGGTEDWTTPLDVKRAVDSYDKEMKARGLRPLRYRLAGTLAAGLYTAGASRASLLAAVKRLELVHVVVDYGRVNDTAPELSGSVGFRGRHAIWVGGGTTKRPGWRKRGGQVEVRLGDSTWGRAGTPKALPQWVPLALVWQWADGAWSSHGGRGWVGGSVACAAKLADAPAPPAPTCEDQVEALQDQLDDAQEQLGEALVVVTRLRKKRLPRALVDQLVALTAAIDAAVPVSPDSTPVTQGMEVPE